MKIKFESLEYQNIAVESICSLFHGQDLSELSFKVDPNNAFGTIFQKMVLGSLIILILQ